MPRVLVIRGDGVAARCCLRLLDQTGFRVQLESVERPKLPAIMLGETAQKLLRDIFKRDDLFDGLPRIRRRAVAWGRTEPIILPHSAVVIPEQVLLERIPYSVSASCHDEDDAPEWTVLAARSLPPGSVEHHFGSRTANASNVRLAASAEPDTCWIESLHDGWLFLLPGGDRSGWLLAVGEVPRLLAESRYVAPRISDVVKEVGRFPCHPRIAESVAQQGWLACGTGAVGFDPLCGDGSGYAAREAILASAVLRAVFDGAPTNAVLAHYRTRLIAGFQRHLQVCRDFYATGGTSNWWAAEANSLERGVAWCGRQLEAAGDFRFRLNGFDLEPVA